ncbi:1-phosphofructokinase [Gracilibacillus boraciitolerans JCM 21714]|uniref:1-phosphofructokinase n=1 Tax=Gracilibacillus boraciitolerans JCM 21714 TaxID=1298598 RepID=W4VFY0_9BACI|nr:1-phosphofructokinase [Gracilibacillus boraciitolerans JCM 21714]
MIYTVTLNPAIDYVVNVDQFQVGEINRSKFDYKEAGGKGINVSRVLNHFGTISTALGFVGGFTGEFITDYLTSLNISHDFVSLQQDTRINVKMKSESEETELNGVSPEIKESDYKTFNSKIRNLTAGDIVVLAGSLPDSLPTDTYRDIVATLRQQGVTAILDSSGIPFSEAIKAKPAFVKPNNHELAELFNEKIETEQDIVTLANRFIKTLKLTMY